MPIMLKRAHSQIIDDAGGVTPVRKALADLGLELPDATVRSWPKGHDGAGSIPPEYWPSFVALGFSTLDELAAAVEARQFPNLAAERGAGREAAA